VPGVVVRRVGDSIEITFPDVPLFQSPRARAVMGKVARAYVPLALQEIGGRISDEAPVGVSGHLAQSWSASGGDETGGIEVIGQEIESIQGRVFSSLPYAIVMDQGRAPGARMPPVDALMLWVERVFQIPSGFDDEELEQTAWAVARSIAKKGIVGRHYVEHGLDKAMPRVEDILQAMGDAIVTELTGGEAVGLVGGPGGGGLV
jgi:hypothetical protein